jgi:hypothetical protein
MIGSDKTTADPRAPKGESSMPKSSPPTSEPSPNADLLSITVNAKTGQIVKVESVDDAGVRRDLSDERKADLAKERGKDTLEALLERAFEAGIACVLEGANPVLRTRSQAVRLGNAQRGVQVGRSHQPTRPLGRSGQWCRLTILRRTLWSLSRSHQPIQSLDGRNCGANERQH